MQQFKDYIWKRIREGILLSWIALCGASIIAYGGVILFLKDKQLISSLRVAAYTVHESMQASDWTLALGHLTTLEKNGPIFHIQLADITAGNQVNLTGPFGERPFGIGSLCKTELVAEGLNLTGCMMVFGGGEIVTLLLFVFLASGLFFIVFKLFSSKMLFFVGKISEELKEVHNLGTSENQVLKIENEEITEIVSIREYILLLLHDTREASKAMAMSELSTQVAHDIRSPLTALDMVVKNIVDLPEEKRILVRNAVNRIHDIANHLLSYYRESNVDKKISDRTSLLRSPSLIMNMLDVIISEKRTQYSTLNIKFDLDIQSDAYTLFTDINPVEFKRMISNLINNSVEAMKDTGNVIVGLSKDVNYAIIKIIDTGYGIPKDIIDNLPNVGSFSSKKEGCGLGLKHAYSLARSYSGNIQISSQIGQGTTINITIPLVKSPCWFPDVIKISTDSTVVVFDDDHSIHEVWSQRFFEIDQPNHKVKIVHFSSVVKLKEYLAQARQIKPDFGNYVFLIDYEILNSCESGLDIIEEFQICSRATLVSSRYEEKDVMSRCEKLGVLLLPKSMAAFIPIKIIEANQIYDAILIDDDPMIHEMWSMTAREVGKNFKGYLTFEEFMHDVEQFDLANLIYIDVNLKHGVRGDEIVKSIYDHGFKNIYLATGYEKSKFLNLPYISGVIGKKPPWITSE